MKSWRVAGSLLWFRMPLFQMPEQHSTIIPFKYKKYDFCFKLLWTTLHIFNTSFASKIFPGIWCFGSKFGIAWIWIIIWVHDYTSCLLCRSRFLCCAMCCSSISRHVSSIHKSSRPQQARQNQMVNKTGCINAELLWHSDSAKRYLCIKGVPCL